MLEGKTPVAGRYRQYQGPMAILVKLIGMATALFALVYTAGVFSWFGFHFQIIQYNAIFMTGILVLTFLICPLRRGDNRGRLPWYDVLLILAILAGNGYVIVNAFELESMAKLLANPEETVLGFIAVAVILEAVRRTVGWPVVILSSAFIAYAKLSYLLPGILASAPQTWPRLMAEVYLSPSGIFGSITTLASTIIVAFIAFGVFFIAIGAGKVFLDLSLAITGSIRGGPAKAAIVASCLFGTLSGSPAANVAVTGAVTIPLMKKTGYSPVFAGAVETVASTGGMLMPPVMGTVAFVMADFLGVSYVTVALAAIIPAILYFTALYVQTDLRAAKEGLRGIPRSELPPIWSTMKKGWQFGLGMVVLVLLLFVLRYPPALSAAYAVGSLVIISLFKKSTRLNVTKFINALSATTESMLMVAPIIASAGIIMATISMTGLGPKLASSLVTIAGGNMLYLLLLAGAVIYIMGMGVSIIVTYILLALLVAPALTEMGLPLIVSHFFIFYMGLSMFISPPYAPTAFVASAISGASPYRTGFQAMRLGIATFIVPFILAYNPALLLIGSPVEIIIAAITAVIGVFALSVGIEGYLFSKSNWLQRILAFGSGIAMMVPGWVSDLFGVGLLVVVIIWQLQTWLKSRGTVNHKAVHESS